MSSAEEQNVAFGKLSKTYDYRAIFTKLTMACPLKKQILISYWSNRPAFLCCILEPWTQSKAFILFIFAYKTLKLGFPITLSGPWKERNDIPVLRSCEGERRAWVRITSKYKVFLNQFYKTTMLKLFFCNFELFVISNILLSLPFLFPRGTRQEWVIELI